MVFKKTSLMLLVSKSQGSSLAGSPLVSVVVITCFEIASLVLGGAKGQNFFSCLFATPVILLIYPFNLVCLQEEDVCLLCTLV